jgi:hypothetical protein
MTNLMTLPLPDSSEPRSRTATLRLDALARLYTRRSALENLIRSLEEYQQTASHRSAEISEFISVRKCS